MERKTKTIDLQGKDYAQVKDRLLEFWKDCPHGKIESDPKFLDDGRVLFSAQITKDQSDEFSPKAPGHAIGKVGEKAKDFEKLETIAIGRALALLGYSAGGEIASSEEMQEFGEWKQEQFQEKVMEWNERLGSCQTLAEVKSLWSDMPVDVKKALESTKDELKKLMESQAVEVVTDADTQAPPKKTRTKKVEDPVSGTLV